MNGSRRRVRWTIASLCLLLGACLAVYPLTLVESKIQVVAPGGAALALFAAAAVGGWPRAGGAAALLIIAEYTLALIIARSAIDFGALAMGTGLFLELELLDLARSGARGAATQKEVLLGRVRYAFSIALLGVIVGSGALAAGTLATGGNAVLLIAGGAAAIGAMWLLVTLTVRAVEGR